MATATQIMASTLPEELTRQARSKLTEQVSFTQAQYELLDKMFPECTDVSQPDAQVRARVGQRSVIAEVKRRVRT